jgi:DNA-binding Xre family transcriptional regulator
LFLYGIIESIGGSEMHLSYNKLWKLLIDKGINKTRLTEITHMSPSTMAKLAKNENVNTDVLVRICYALQCDVGDVVEFIGDR